MATHDQYYVPAQSKWPIIATVGLLVTVYGLGTWFNDLKAARPESHGPLIFFVGGLIVAYMMFGWFGAVIKESRAGLYSSQLDRSFRWGMTWFIFSEVMFFLAFFGALFYVRHRLAALATQPRTGKVPHVKQRTKKRDKEHHFRKNKPGHAPAKRTIQLRAV